MSANKSELGENEKLVQEYKKLVQEWEVKRKENPLYLQHLNDVSIPFSTELGFQTVSIESAVLGKIKEHWCHSVNDGSQRVAGICFGSKKNTQIVIKDCFKFKYSSDENIIIDGCLYETNLNFLGIYSNGTILDEEDVLTVSKLSQTSKHAVFLIKFTWCQASDEVSTIIFENVFDVCNWSWMERLLSAQLCRLPQPGLIISECNNSGYEEPKQLFYLTNDWTWFNVSRYKSDISDNQRANWKESFKSSKIKWQTLKDYQNTLTKIAKDGGWFWEKHFLTYDPEKDYLNLAEKICYKAKIDLRFIFEIPLNGGNQVECNAILLDLTLITNKSSSITESRNLASFKTLREITMADMINRSKRLPCGTIVVPGASELGDGNGGSSENEE